MKALQIAWKDTLTRFRDWKALVGLLGAPLLVSALIGLAFGNLDFNGADAPITDIEMIVVNLDEGDLGQAYVDVFTSEGLDELLNPHLMDDLATARKEIEQGNSRAVVYLPADFSASILPSTGGTSGSDGKGAVQVYTDPAASVSPYIVQSIVEQITARLNTLLMAGEVSADQVVAYAPLLGPEIARLAGVISEEINASSLEEGSNRLQLERVQVGDGSGEFDVFSFFVPGMAVFFLMFSMFDGSRSILLEETRGTLPRLMSTPTPTAEIILGKMGGTFLTGLLQFSILMAASSLIFGVNWGNSIPGLITVVILTVFAASGLGALLTSFARTETQVSIMSTTVALVFGALGGSFFPSQNFEGAIDIVSKFTLNRWALDAFLALLENGGSFADIIPNALVLGGIGLVTFILALLAFQRRFVK